MMQSPDRSGSPAGEPESAEFVLDLPSDLDVIEGTVAYLVDRCRAFAFDGSRLTLNLPVGVTEALANAMLYGNRCDPTRHVRIEVSLDPDRVALRIEDGGNGFNPESVPDPTLPGNVERSRGRGLFLLRELMDEVEFNERGNAVRIVLYREDPGEKGINQ